MPRRLVGRADRRPFPLLAELPPELRDVILDFHWDQQLLWALDLPTIERPIAELTWHLGLPFWACGGQPFQVTPLEVATDPGRFAEQYARTMATDLRYPLDVVRRPEGQLTILDGVHRLLRAYLASMESVRVRVLEWEELDSIAVRGGHEGQ
ncbi:ParB N-terminal domain-containing protein [Kribbella sp. CA-247076]|uniref:ParB N-terminal domain-containing protein n=1 Tax=Kribbella sp. CA-247076 TaxID=3239941 RepID=UPI003D909CA8